MPRGVPQIDITFNINANGILNVSAIEKSTGKENKITITNDKGRLSQKEIDRIINEAERYKAQVEHNRERIEAKNWLENCLFNMKSTINDEKLPGKFSENEKQKLLNKINSSISWLESNQIAEKEEYEKKQKEIKIVCLPILQNLSGGGMPNGMPGGFSDASSYGTGTTSSGFGSSTNYNENGPKIEEID